MMGATLTTIRSFVRSFAGHAALEGRWQRYKWQLPLLWADAQQRQRRAGGDFLRLQCPTHRLRLLCRSGASKPILLPLLPSTVLSRIVTCHSRLIGNAHVIACMHDCWLPVQCLRLLCRSSKHLQLLHQRGATTLSVTAARRCRLHRRLCRIPGQHGPAALRLDLEWFDV